MEAGNAKAAFVIRRSAQLETAIVASKTRVAVNERNGETLERFAIFVGDLAIDDAFRCELDNGGARVWPDLNEKTAGAVRNHVIVREVAGLGDLQGGGACGESVELESAFGVGERI